MYYLTKIETYKDGSTTGISTFEYADIDIAIQTFHSSLAYAMASPNVATVCCVLFNFSGNLVKREYWERPAENTL